MKKQKKAPRPFKVNKQYLYHGWYNETIQVSFMKCRVACTSRYVVIATYDRFRNDIVVYDFDTEKEADNAMRQFMK